MTDDGGIRLTAAQEIGMARVHLEKVVECLERAAELGAVVLTRDSIAELVAKGDRALDQEPGANARSVALTEIVETLRAEIEDE